MCRVGTQSMKVGVRTRVSRGDTINEGGRKNPCVAWGHNLCAVGAPGDKESARAGGDTSVQTGGWNQSDESLARGKRRSV